MVRGLLDMAEVGSLKVWSLLDMGRIPTWFNKRVVLLGDAAHPFLPRKFSQPTCPPEAATSITNMG